jgi:hypothetical protein
MSLVINKRPSGQLSPLACLLSSMSGTAHEQTNQRQQIAQEERMILEICRTGKHLVTRQLRSEVCDWATNLCL